MKPSDKSEGFHVAPVALYRPFDK